MHNVEYVRDVDVDVRYRVNFVEDRGRILQFAVQLEISTENLWRP
jgi:hypothetical protein